MANQNQVYMVGGIAFADPEQAKLAQQEQKRIELLQQKLDYNNVAAVAAVYSKAQQGQIFKTAIGISYMLQLRDFLLQNGYEEGGIPPLILPETSQQLKSEEQMLTAQEERIRQRENVWKKRMDAQKEKELGLRRKLQSCFLIIGVLVVMVIALFVISQTSNNLNILNYKTKLNNEYSTWEQQLKEREAVIREKEKELQISQ